jgi:hypothetical protein
MGDIDESKRLQIMESRAKKRKVAEYFEKALIEADCDVVGLRLELSDDKDDMAVITWVGGGEKRVNIEMDSPRAIISDIINNAWL